MKPHIQLSYEILLLSEIEHNGKSHSISTNAKIIYSYIAGFRNNNRQAFPSMGGMSKTLNLGSEQVIRREVKNLVAMGLLSIVERPGNSHLYEVLPLPSERQQEAKQEPEQVQDVQTPAPAVEAVTEAYSDDNDIIPELIHGYTPPVRDLKRYNVLPIRTSSDQDDALEEAKRRVANNKTPLRTYTKQECEEPF
ncbi:MULTISPECIES: helix-turn-helix domain-containing protein [unclassified Pantoea]|uniref:helix-turn-helix domain-containing protein n=1 Tax=unclassified Pantoea TaxID=2630326 RepID=UPI0023DC7671|nr:MULTISPECIES: helix-turn-helix domain-containing protein [unclassified Pantoea]MDF2043263.1 helix-turn-helix domain-containing protein [Pantoea sp. Cr_R14]MDF2072316.1 helix-turn-helix domain-containing protein [Pantoea sp. Cr_R13]MDF2080565.1 helix-turn-helix domain-containing protein [Pantoea sp. Cr_R21]